MHESYSHHAGEGRCQVEIIKSESTFHPIQLGGDIQAWTQNIEYDEQCPCEHFTLVKPSKRPRRRTLIEMSLKQYMDLPNSSREEHHGRQL